MIRVLFLLLSYFCALNAALEDGKMKNPKYPWENYYKKANGKPARATTLKALKKLLESGGDLSSEWALDLGCGAGQDTFEILKYMNVVAVDQEKSGLDFVKAHYATSPGILADKLLLMEASFSDPKTTASFWEPSKYILINASFSLPFCPREHFDDLWDKIKNSLKSKGIFSGQFFGPRHSWVYQKRKSFFSEEEILEKLKGFNVEINSEETDEKDASGEMVHWHIFHVIAQKK